MTMGHVGWLRVPILPSPSQISLINFSPPGGSSTRKCGYALYDDEDCRFVPTGIIRYMSGPIAPIITDRSSITYERKAPNGKLNFPHTETA